ncbi:hypothetical protein FPV67DRAFT_98519 [Lyophyllum atratum]|nr:hypothetical protein FPV67DRAFT_98519 [Lyophyllum atratum]
MEVLSQDISTDDSTESEIRVRIGDQIKYIVVEPGAMTCDILSFPPDFISHMPILPGGDWTCACVFGTPGNLAVEVSNATLAGVQGKWHPNVVDVQHFTPLSRFKARVHEVQLASKIVVAKIARFEFEIPRVEQETAAYQAIAGHGIGPTFIGHLAEHGRVMGFLIEKLEGRRADITDLEACQHAVRQLHSLGIVHGDLNRHNFVVSPTGGVTLLDFENATLNGSQEAMNSEYAQLSEQLQEDSGRGGGWLPDSDSE